MAQSLADVAREQRNDPNHPKASRVYTNSDVGADSVSDAPSSNVPSSNTAAPEVKTPSEAKTPKTKAPAQAAVNPERALMQRRVNELAERVQRLRAEIDDLTKQRTALNRTVYGDPNRAQEKDAAKNLDAQLAAKQGELASATQELNEEIERARRSSVER